MIKKISFFFIVFVPVSLLVQYFLFEIPIGLKTITQAIVTGLLSVAIILFLEKRSGK